MRDSDKASIIICAMFFATVALVVGMLVGYNLYTNAKNRELYAACLEVHGKADTGRFGATCSTY